MKKKKEDKIDQLLIQVAVLDEKVDGVHSTLRDHIRHHKHLFYVGLAATAGLIASVISMLHD